MALEPLYEVVSPVGEQAYENTEERRGKKVAGAKPLAGLHGKKIGLVWTVFTNGNILLEAFRDLLAERYEGLEFAKLPPGRALNWGDYPDKTIGAFARENGIDAAIVAAAC